MSISARRKKIEEVFTPRNAEVNQRMYVSRPRHEAALEKAVRGGRHIVICGNSGNGKSWLYKAVAKRMGWKLFTANAGIAATVSSVTTEIANTLIPSGSIENFKYKSELELKSNTLFKAGAATEREYNVQQMDVLQRAFQEARAEAGNGVVLLVLDNLEAIFAKTELMNELGNIILLLDDQRYSQYNIRILLVGIPANIINYYQSIDNLESVSNRLTEIPVVTGLLKQQVAGFVDLGLRNSLKINITDEDLKILTDHIFHVTLGIPQRLHEYCEALAFEIESNDWQYDPEQIKVADTEYCLASLLSSYSVLERCLNQKETKEGRRNQVIYSLGQLTEPQFDTLTVERKIREIFPNSTFNKKLAISQTLAELATPDRPLLTRLPIAASYRFSDPLHLMCLRLALHTKDEKLVKKTIRH